MVIQFAALLLTIMVVIGVLLHKAPPVIANESNLEQKTYSDGRKNTTLSPNSKRQSDSAESDPELRSIQDSVSEEISDNQKTAIIEALREAATTYSPDGIAMIEPSLYSPDTEIRQVAAEAMVVLGESGGAVALRRAASKLNDPREASALIEKAEYLELPPRRR